MARILQIRRGTTQQNDNFTGMPGEITFDTEANTLRVHDGATLGGHTLARQNTLADNAEFDVNTVPDTCWQSIFNRLLPPICKFADSISMTFGNTTYIEHIFDIQTPAITAQSILECFNAEAGYSSGDTVMSFGIGNNTVYPPNLFTDTNGLHVRLYAANQQFWVPNKDTGNKNTITPANWRIKFRVCY